MVEVHGLLNGRVLLFLVCLRLFGHVSVCRLRLLCGEWLDEQRGVLSGRERLEAFHFLLAHEHVTFRDLGWAHLNFNQFQNSSFP